MRARRARRILPIATGVLAAMFCLSALTRERAQTVTNAQRDIYANFVGVWVGTDKYVENGKEVTKALRLTIQETKNQESKKKDGMKWEYLYGTGDQKDDRRTRRVTFHPSKSEIILTWGNDDEDHYKAVDLDALAKNGYGIFYAINTGIQDGKKVTRLAKFDLETETLRYGWFHSEDGKNFSQDSSFVLRRQATAPINSH